MSRKILSENTSALADTNSVRAATRPPIVLVRPSIGGRNSKKHGSKKISKSLSNKENMPSAGSVRVGGSRQAVSCVFITVNVGRTELDKSVRYDFVNSFHDVTQYCCSIERGTVGSSSEQHIHCFLSFINKVKYREIRQFIVDTFQFDIVDVQGVRNRKRVLSYISKEDLDIYYNVSVSDS